MGAVYDGPPPNELVKAMMCHHFHCLPSQLEQEPADLVYQYYQVYNIYHNGISKRNPKTMG